MTENTSEPIPASVYQYQCTCAGPLSAWAGHVFRPCGIDVDVHPPHSTSMKIFPPTHDEQCRHLAKRHYSETYTQINIADKSPFNYCGTRVETPFLNTPDLASGDVPGHPNATTETLITRRSDHGASRWTGNIALIQVVLLSEVEVWSEVFDAAITVQTIKERLSAVVAPLDQLQLWPDSVLGQSSLSRTQTTTYMAFKDDDLVVPGTRLVLYIIPDPDELLCWQFESMVLHSQRRHHLVDEPCKKRPRK